MAAAQEVELEEGHMVVGQQPEVDENGLGDTERLGEGLDLGQGLARGRAVGHRRHQHAVRELLAELAFGKARGQLGRGHRRQGIEVGLDAEDHLLCCLHSPRWAGPIGPEAVAMVFMARRPSRAAAESGLIRRMGRLLVSGCGRAVLVNRR